MGSWGITMRESDYGLDLLGSVIDRQLKAADFSIFNVTDALEVIKADIMEEIRQANRGYSAVEMVISFSERFPHNFTEGALLVAECLTDYYRTGELIVYDYVGENYDQVEHRIKEFVVTKANLFYWSDPQFCLIKDGATIETTVVNQKEKDGVNIPGSCVA